MAVIYGPQSKGSDPLGILGTLMSFVPGMQPIGMGIGALNGALKGNPLSVATNLMGMGKGTAPQAPTPQAPTPPAPQLNWRAPDYNQMWQDFNKNRGMY